MKIASYDTDLTAAQWHLIRRFLPAAQKRGRPRTVLRQVLNAILYLVKTGAQWRLLPKKFPPWQTVYHHFRQWSRTGLLARLNARLRAKVRQAVGKHPQPTAASLDRQTVRASAHGGQVGYDAAKKTKGRKRFLLVDTLGLLLGVSVEPANGPERKGARTLLATVLADYPELLKLWVDGGFNGPEFSAWVQTQHSTLVVEVVKRLAYVPGFTLLPKRWVVERTFGCPRCQLSNWYHVDELRQEIVCVGCGSKHALQTEEKWSYSLNSLAQTGVSQGVLGVLHALTDLASHAHTFFAFSPSLELFKNGANKPWHEVDVICVANGDYIIGEVKEGFVQKEAFDELAEVAEALRPQRAIIFLPLEYASKQPTDLAKWLKEIQTRLAPRGISAEIFTLPEY
jgi:putative transposase